MEIRILGPLEVTVGGEPIEIRGAKERAILTALALRAGSVVGADRLIDEVWGENLPANPANALQVRISRLRKHLGDVLETQAPGYRLAVEPEQVDARRMELLLEQARSEMDPARAAQLLTDALALFRGEVLAEFGHGDANRSEATRLESLRLEAIEARLDAELAQGHHMAIVADLERLIVEHPLREGLRARLMIALYRAGRQAEALRAYQDTRRELAEELGIDPGPELQRLEERILGQDDALLLPHPDAALRRPTAPPAMRQVAPLPPRLNSFVGRSREMGELQDLVKTSRVVTITGPGGVGKTRLAIETARSLADDFGAHLIELAAVTSTASVAEAVAEALEIQSGRQVNEAPSPRALLTGLLAEQRVVLVFDNCEQVLDDAASVVDHLVQHTADVRIIATSQERLGLGHERVFPLAPLDVGDGDEAGDAEILFLERAEAVNPSIRRTSELMRDVRAICRRLDGIPLAVELAASRMAGLSASDILQRLDDRFALLTGGSRTAMARHQTLRAAVDWSHDALSDGERLMFSRLGVTRGSWDLGLAAALVDGEMTETEAMDHVAGLVDRSLVVRSEADGGRYRLLETLRVYALEQLEASGSLDTTRRRFSDHYRAMAYVPGPHTRHIAEVEQLRVERDNIRLSVEFLLDLGDVDEALHSCGHLAYFWFTEALLEDERNLIERALAAGGSPVARARGLKALLLTSFLEIGFRDEDALSMADEMVSAEKAEGEPEFLVVAQFIQSVFLVFLGQPDGFDVIDETRALASQLGDEWVVGFCDVIKGLGVAALPSGEWAPNSRSGSAELSQPRRLPEEMPSRLLLERGVETLRRVGEWWALSFALGSLGRLLTSLGQYEEALAITEEATGIAQRHGTRWIEANLAIESGNIEVLLGRFADAHVSFGTGRRLADEIGSVSLRAFAANGLGMAAHWEGREQDAIEFHTEASVLYDRIGGSFGRALALDRMGFAHQRLGDKDEAFEAHLQSLELVRNGPEPTALAMSIEGLSGAFALSGQPNIAASLLGCASSMRIAIGRPLSDGEALDTRRIEMGLRDVMGAAEFEAAYEAGTRCDASELIDRAVEAGRQVRAASRSAS